MCASSEGDSSKRDETEALPAIPIEFLDNLFEQEAQQPPEQDSIKELYEIEIRRILDTYKNELDNPEIAQELAALEAEFYLLVSDAGIPL